MIQLKSASINWEQTFCVCKHIEKFWLVKNQPFRSDNDRDICWATWRSWEPLDVPPTVEHLQIIVSSFNTHLKSLTFLCWNASTSFLMRRDILSKFSCAMSCCRSMSAISCRMTATRSFFIWSSARAMASRFLVRDEVAPCQACQAFTRSCKEEEIHNKHVVINLTLSYSKCLFIGFFRWTKSNWIVDITFQGLFSICDLCGFSINT